MVDIVDRIANGTANLLGVEDICKRLGVSRTTFDRWVRNSGGKTGSGVPIAVAVASHLAGTSTSSVQNFLDGAENASEGAIKFPPPDIRIGNSPKWEMETLKTWLRANVTTGS